MEFDRAGIKFYSKGQQDWVGEHPASRNKEQQQEPVESRKRQRDVHPDEDAEWNHGEQAVAYVRPHDVEVSRVQNAVCHSPAVITAINAVGPLVRIELERRDHGDECHERIDSHIARSRQQELELKMGDAVYFGFVDFQIYPREVTDSK